MNYKEISDYKINLLIAKRLGLLINDEQCASLKAKSSSVLVNDIVSQWEFNPCNNWADIGPLINEVYITINRDSCQAQVSSYFNPEFVISCGNTDKDILRAVAIVCLAFKDADNG